MRAIMVMFDSLNRRYLEPYSSGTRSAITPNFNRLAEKSVVFDCCYAGSLPCMPARRELHTGRYNFLHRSWGPMEPFDVSMPQLLDSHEIHSHLVSDHGHYWEDGGATYHTRYSTWENFRGQEGDAWKGISGGIKDADPNLIEFNGYRGKLYRQDLINRTQYQNEKDHPQIKTFDAGLEFMAENRNRDNWFLQIETFDPHEPFFCYERFKQLYPHEYDGKRFDWPDYAPVDQTEAEIREAQLNYAALVSMCDEQLGRVLDSMDQFHLWEDTMLIVNTDHGYLLGEHKCWAKNYMPLYREITELPLFLYDPRTPEAGRRSSLVQTVDLPVTLLNYFDVPVPPEMTGKDLAPVLKEDSAVREYALFGIHGGHVCVTDGHFVYMKCPVKKSNLPLYEYTLMPTHMAGFFSENELRSAKLCPGFSFTRNLPLLKMETQSYLNSYEQGNLLYDLKNDPGEEQPIRNDTLEMRMTQAIVKIMKEEDAPAEQYERLGLTTFV